MTKTSTSRAFGFAVLTASAMIGCGSPPAPTPVPVAASAPATPASATSAPFSGCPAQAQARAAAAAFRKEGRLIRARETLRSSLEQCADDPEATVALAETLTALGRYEEARGLLDGAVSRAAAATREAASRQLEAESAARSSHPPDHARAQQSYLAAVLADFASDHVRAREGFLQAWRSWPERTEYLVDAGLSARLGGDGVLARSLFDRASVEFEARHGAGTLQLEHRPYLMSSTLHPTISKDGRYVVVCSGDEVLVYDARTWSVRTFFQDRSYPHPVVARLSPDNSVLAIGNSNRTLQLVDALTGNLITTAKGHTDGILDLAFRADGGAVATTSQDKTVRIWEIPSGRLVATLDGHEGSTRRVAFSPDGALVVSTSDDRTARVWNASDGKLLRTLKGHAGPLRGLAIRHDGKQLVTSSEDKTVRTWDVDSGTELKVMRGHTGTVWRVAFSPDGTRVASLSADDTVREWNAATGESLRTIRSTSPGSTARSRSDTLLREPADSLRLASIGGLPLMGGGGGTSSYSSVVVVDLFYRADGKLLAFDLDRTTRDLAARLWDVDGDRSLRSIRPSSTSLAALELSPDGKRLAQAYLAGTVRVWELDGGAPHSLQRVSARGLTSARWIPGRTSLAVADYDGAVFLVDPAGATPPRPIGKHGSPVRSLAATPDGTTLVSISEKGDLKVWNTDDGKLLRSFSDAALSSAGAAAFHSDGRRLVVARAFRGASVVDTTAPSVVATVREELPAQLIGFSADGAVVQLGRDGTLAKIDASTGEVKKREPGTATEVHLCDWIRERNPQAACVDGRSAPRFGTSASYRLGMQISVLPDRDLAANESSGAELNIFRPGRDGIAVRLLGTSDSNAACALKDSAVELFGEDARRLMACAWGNVRMPFEVCEDKYVATGVIARAMKP